MGLLLDKIAAVEILLSEAERAETEEAPEEWVERIERLSEICETHNVRTHIAFVGTAILAKATNRNVDPFSIKATSSRPGAYSARGFGHGALVPKAAELGIDLGTRGREPLNNQPYFRSVAVSSDMPIKETTRPALNATMQILADLSRVATEDEARGVLRAFIKVRRGYRPVYPPASHGALGISPWDFADETHSFVADSSEGGRRAQAAVAGLLAAHFGIERVVSNAVNDPDRSLPGDVGVQDDSEGWAMLFEVRDKPVTVSDVRIFAEKAIEAGCPRAGIVAVSSVQPKLDLREQIEFAARHGVLLLFYPSWRDLVYSLLFWGGESAADVIDAAHGAIYDQLVSIEATVDAVARWNALRENS